MRRLFPNGASVSSRPYYALSEVFTVGGTANSAPVFTDSATPRPAACPRTPGAFTDVGALVAATDADTATIGELLTYSLGGTDAASFRHWLDQRADPDQGRGVLRPRDQVPLLRGR